MKALSIITIAFVSLSLFASAEIEKIPELEEILNKFSEAAGTEFQWEKLRSTRISGNIFDEEGQRIDFTFIKKYANKTDFDVKQEDLIRKSVKFPPDKTRNYTVQLTSIFNGENYYKILKSLTGSESLVTEMNAKEIKSFRTEPFFEPLFYTLTNQLNVEAFKLSDSKGKDTPRVYIIEAYEPNDALTIRLHIDAEEYLTQKIEYIGEDFNKEITVLEYEKIFPLSFIKSAVIHDLKSNTVVKYRVDSIENNIGVTTASFNLDIF